MSGSDADWDPVARDAQGLARQSANLQEEEKLLVVWVEDDEETTRSLECALPLIKPSWVEVTRGSGGRSWRRL